MSERALVQRCFKFGRIPYLIESVINFFLETLSQVMAHVQERGRLPTEFVLLVRVSLIPAQRRILRTLERLKRCLEHTLVSSEHAINSRSGLAFRRESNIYTCCLSPALVCLCKAAVVVIAEAWTW